MLRFYEDLSERESAEILGCSVGALNQLVVPQRRLFAHAREGSRMIDIEQLVRETLERHEADMPMLDPVHVHPLAVRTRRRQVANSIGVGLVALVIALGAIGGVVRSFGRRVIDRRSNPSPSPRLRSLFRSGHRGTGTLHR